MDSKFYVSLEAARLLKEKGYNEETIHYYSSAGKLYLGSGHFNHNACAVNLSAPTKAEAIDWLEGKNLTITIDWIRFNEQRRWCYGICNNETCDWEGSRYEYITRLEAEEAAIIKALELYERSK
jgi:hypothetical protein